MASVNRSKLVGNHFESPLRVVSGFFQKESFNSEQVQGLKEFFQGKNDFFSAGTGYGKSVVFEPKPKLT